MLSLFHVAIKTGNLAATNRFYKTILGLVEHKRPDFGYPGAWLGSALPGAAAIIHIYAGGPAMGAGGQAPVGTAAIDHVSLATTGYHATRARIAEAGLDWREFSVPGTTLGLKETTVSPGYALARARACMTLHSFETL